MNLIILVLQLLLACFTVAKSYTKSKDAVLLSNVRSLTLQTGKKTTARRVSAIPQLTCVGGNGKGLYDVDVMRCKNSGSEYDPEDIQWTCQANLPPEFKLGSTEVVCEGYDSSADPYVLKGSCGVEYRLVLTAMGEEKYGSGSWFKSRAKDSSSPSSGLSSKSLGSILFTLFFWAAFIGILGLIVYSIFNPQGQNQPRLPRNPLGGGGGFWGGGGGGDDDPPPPYTPRAPPRSKPSSSTPRSSRSSNSGPGFWSGAGVGAAGGYMAGQYMANRTQQQQQARQQQNMFGAGPSGYNQGGSSWFGGGGGGSSGAGPSTSPSSSRYESTGFGGTRRR